MRNAWLLLLLRVLDKIMKTTLNLTAEEAKLATTKPKIVIVRPLEITLAILSKICYINIVKVVGLFLLILIFIEVVSFGGWMSPITLTQSEPPLFILGIRKWVNRQTMNTILSL